MEQQSVSIAKGGIGFYVYMYVCARVLVVCVCIFICGCVDMCVDMRGCMCMYVRMWIYVWIFELACAYMYVSICPLVTSHRLKVPNTRNGV